MINPDDPPEIQVEKQAKIIDALIRRANRQRDLGPSAFQAFQSALELQEQMLAQTRDLERAVTELESAKYERERTRRNLVEALASMSDGIALFSDGKLEHCNELFRDVLPDLAKSVRAGLLLERFLDMFAQSAHFISSDKPLAGLIRRTGASSAVVELCNDRWYKMSVQRTSSQNVVLLLTEITSLVRKNRDEKATLIHRQADYLQAVFQNMSSGICTFSASGETRMHNEQFRALLGLPAKVLQTGVPLRDVLSHMVEQGHVGADDRERAEGWRDELMERGQLRRRIRHGPGRVLDIQANGLPDGGFVVEVKDATLEARAKEHLEKRVMERTAELTRTNLKLTRQYEAQARVEEELRLAKERAEAAVSSKTRFLAAASHDLLQPINAAKLLISTLSETTRATKHAAIVERIERSFGSAEQLLHSLLDISRLESPEPDAVAPAEVCLAPVMESVFADQTPIAEKKGVSLRMVPSRAFVLSDPVYLLRSAQNLVVNAIQYTDAGGRVLFGCRHEGDRVVLEVWDTGMGIAKEDQGKIFEEFTRAGKVRPGSGMGLGLSVVDRAARLLGHTLDLRSTPGVGSVFRIAMARVASPVAADAAPESLPAAEEKALDYIVLVIDNDPEVLGGMTLWLEQWGASVLAARTIAEAIGHVRDMGMAPDVILADYQLDEEETGIDLIARIRDMCSEDVPAILITANRSKSLWRAGIEADFSVMAKPAKLKRLRSLIDWRVRRHRATVPEIATGTKVARDLSA